MYKNSWKVLILIIASMPLYNFSCECYEGEFASVGFVIFNSSNSCYLAPENIETGWSFNEVRYNARYELIEEQDTSYIISKCESFFDNTYNEVIPFGGQKNYELITDDQSFELSLNPAEDASTFLWKNEEETNDTLTFSYSRNEDYSRYCGYNISFSDLSVTKNTFSKSVVADDGSWVAIYTN